MKNVLASTHQIVICGLLSCFLQIVDDTFTTFRYCGARIDFNSAAL